MDAGVFYAEPRLQQSRATEKAARGTIACLRYKFPARMILCCQPVLLTSLCSNSSLRTRGSQSIQEQTPLPREGQRAQRFRI